ncbi:DUF4184 family protein [Bailinhaonella thermotolerans]|uniref:DUF4184 family protein n=1 Tax=Bailinhaonella thermotolerans TaxID=1070861 RepID=UPI00192A54DC|nr:DUF4184 family protein [Bailinhaonella thermotolerans]
MPFTLAHPAAVIPFARGPLVAGALVAGSVVPDLPYFVDRDDLRYLTHSAAGSLTYDVVLGLALLAVFRVALRRPLLDLLPPAARARVPAPRDAVSALRGPRGRSLARAAARVWWVYASLALGAVTHVVWDGVTHGDGMEFAELETPRTSAVFQVLQHGSSLLGLAAVGWWALRRLRRTPPREVPPVLPAALRWSVLTAFALAGLAGALYGALAGFGYVADGQRLEDAAVVAIDAAAVAALAYCAAWWGWRLARGRRRERVAAGASRFSSP